MSSSAERQPVLVTGGTGMLYPVGIQALCQERVQHAIECIYNGNAFFYPRTILFTGDLQGDCRMGVTVFVMDWQRKSSGEAFSGIRRL